MTNSLTTRAGSMSAADFAGAADAGFSAAAPKSEGGGTPFLKIDKETGVWTYGQEDHAVPTDGLWGVFPGSFAAGYVAWKGLTLEAKRMSAVGAPPVDPATLPPVVAKTGWEDNVAVALVCVESKTQPEVVGTVVRFEQRSRGGVEAWNKLYDATVARARARAADGGDDFAALVQLGHTSYEHKEWGKVYKPVFSIDGWDSPTALIADFGQPPAIGDVGGDDAQSESAAPVAASRRARVAAPVEDAEVVSEAPARRRRQDRG